MRSHRSPLRMLSVATALLATGYVGCATQEDSASDMLGDSAGDGGSVGSADAAGGAAGAKPVSAGGASGSSPRPVAGAAGTSSSTAGSGGSAMNVAGAGGSSAATGGSSGSPSGGTASGAGTGGGATGGTGTMPPDTTAPSAPGMLQTSDITSNSVTVSWTASTDNVGVTGYRLFNGSTEVGTRTGTIFTFKGLGPGTAYTFGVEAYDAADNTSARATKGATTTGSSACNASTSVAKLVHGQTYTASGSACIELTVNPAWNPVDVLLEQTAGGALSYAYTSCTGSGSGTIATVLKLFAGTNPGCNFFVRLTGSGTVAYYD